MIQNTSKQKNSVNWFILIELFIFTAIVWFTCSDNAQITSLAFTASFLILYGEIRDDSAHKDHIRVRSVHHGFRRNPACLRVLYRQHSCSVDNEISWCFYCKHSLFLRARIPMWALPRALLRPLYRLQV